MKPESLTVEILRAIRDEIKTTNTRLESAETRLDTRLESVETRLDARLENVEQEIKGLRRCQLATETRLATELVGVVQAVNEVRDLLKDNAGLSRRVDDHEQRLAQIEERLSS